MTTMCWIFDSGVVPEPLAGEPVRGTTTRATSVTRDSNRNGRRAMRDLPSPEGAFDGCRVEDIPGSGTPVKPGHGRISIGSGTFPPAAARRSDQAAVGGPAGQLVAVR